MLHLKEESSRYQQCVQVFLLCGQSTPRQRLVCKERGEKVGDETNGESKASESKEKTSGPPATGILSH